MLRRVSSASRVLFLVAAASAFAVLLSTRALVAQAPAPVDPKFTEALQKGEAALKTRKWEDALGAFKQANNILDKKSPAALYGVARAHHGLGAFKSEAEASAEALKYVGGDKRFEAMLHNQRGMALFSMAEKNTDKAIKDAEAEFRLAVALPQAPPIAHYNLGLSLLKQSRDEEGATALKAYTAFGLKTPEVDLAVRMIENPRRGRENFAPDFSLTSMQGEFYSAKELEGKVVFLDFWGQWCGPCRDLTLDLVKLNKKYRDNPKFVMLGHRDGAASRRAEMEGLHRGVQDGLAAVPRREAPDHRRVQGQRVPDQRRHRSRRHRAPARIRRRHRHDARDRGCD